MKEIKKIIAILLLLVIASQPIWADGLTDAIGLARDLESFRNQEPRMDLNHDGFIDLSDAVLLARQRYALQHPEKQQTVISGSSRHNDLDKNAVIQLTDEKGFNTRKRFVLNNKDYFYNYILINDGLYYIRFETTDKPLKSPQQIGYEQIIVNIDGTDLTLKAKEQTNHNFLSIYLGRA